MPRPVISQPIGEKRIVKACEALRRQRVDVFSGAVQLVKTGRELCVPDVQPDKLLPDLLRMARDLVGERAKDVTGSAGCTEKTRA